MSILVKNVILAGEFKWGGNQSKKFDYLKMSTSPNAGCNIDSCVTTEDSVKKCMPCVFPFTYDGITHTECTYYGGYSKPWCGTKTDENGIYQGGNWGYCNMDKCTSE